MAEYRYWAFISYSHQDEEWAGWLHRAIETYRVPRNVSPDSWMAAEVLYGLSSVPAPGK